MTPTTTLPASDVSISSAQPDAPPSFPDDRAIERNYIGSSDAAKVANLSPWGSPLSVWNRLVGLTTYNDAPSLRMWLGKRMEPIILDLYEQRTGKRPAKLLEDDDPPILSAAHNFIGAHVDFDGLEVKTSTSAREWGDDGSTVTIDAMAIPLHYFLQVQHQMYVMGWDVIDVAVLIGHDQFRQFTVPADQQVIGRLVEAEVELWGYKERGEPPPQDDHDSRRAYLRAKFPVDELPMRLATPEDEILVSRWRAAKAAFKAAKADEELAADRLERAIGKASGLSGWVSWKAQTRRDIDRGVLQDQLRSIDRLDILATATRSTTFRVLRSMRKEDDGE